MGSWYWAVEERTEKESPFYHGLINVDAVFVYENVDVEMFKWLSTAIMTLFSLVFLSTELQALKILHSKKSKGSHLEKHNEIYQEVQAICDALGLPNSSSSGIPPLLTGVEQKVWAFTCPLCP